MSFFYGTVSVTSGSRARATDAGGDGTSCLLIGNESPLTIKVTLDGTAVVKSLYPGTVDIFDLPARNTFTGTVFFDPTSNLSNSNSWPSSYVQIDVFGIGERPQGTYPMALPRNTNVGNVVSTVGGTASAVQNDANPSGTSVVEATVSGDGLSAVSILNQGKVVFGSTLNPGFLQVRGVAGNNDDLLFDASTGILTIQNKLLANLITAITGNDFGVHVETGHRVVDTINGVDTFSVNGNGMNLLAGTLALLTGSLSRISKFTGACINGKVTVNHGLGTTPDIAVVWFNLSGQPVAATVGVNQATMTSTQVDVWASVASNFVGLAFKF